MYEGWEGPTNLSAKKFPGFDEASFSLPLYCLEFYITLSGSWVIKDILTVHLSHFSFPWGRALKNGTTGEYCGLLYWDYA